MKKDEEQFEWEVYQMVQMGADRKVAETIINKIDKFKYGVWQYIIDHKLIQPNGYIKITLFVRDKNDFFRRVSARENGEFKRYDVEKTESGRGKIQKNYDELNARRSRHKGAKEGKNVFKKILAILYQKYIAKI